jgi:hypothetical protein
VVRRDHLLVAGCAVAQPDGQHVVAVRRGRRRRVTEQHAHAARRAMRREQRLDRRERGARLVRERADVARAGVELRAGARRGRERVVRPVMRADRVAQAPVARGHAEALDPWVLVGRDGLAGQLAAEPGALGDEDDFRAALGGSERRGDAAQPAARDEHLRPLLAHADKLRPGGFRHAGRSARRAPAGPRSSRRAAGAC